MYVIYLSIIVRDFEFKCLNVSDKLKVLNENLLPRHAEGVLLTRQSSSPRLVIVAWAEHEQVATFSHSCQGQQGRALSGNIRN